MLYFSDKKSERSKDRLAKIRGLFDKLREIFKKSFSPFRNLCIDESLLLFKGRLFFKHYIPSKRNRFGIKSFVLCDCSTGYVLDVIVYTGSTSEMQAFSAKLGKAGNIVATLMQPYLGKGHQLFVNNWYYGILCCLNICTALQQMQCGTATCRYEKATCRYGENARKITDRRVYF